MVDKFFLDETRIKPIPKSFSKQGWEYRQVYKVGPWAIYKRFKGTDENPRQKHYETVILRICDPHPEAQDRRHVETYPSDSLWGAFGFTCPSVERASFRLIKLMQNRKAGVEESYTKSLASILTLKGDTN